MATEAVLLLQTADPMLAASMGGAAGGAVKGIILGGRRLLVRRCERLRDAFVAAEGEAGRTRQQLFEHALDQDDERRLDLLVNAFGAAAREADGRKVRAYGRLAASGVLAEDEAKVDLAARVFSTLASLDPADVKILLYLLSSDGGRHLIRRAEQNGSIDENLPALDEVFPEPDVVGPVLTRLESVGAVISDYAPRSMGGTTVDVTAYGRRCGAELLRGEDAGTPS